jgi:VIT1/CCC1 family predicted Fe2+/Mn2+ transporter
MGMTLVTLFLFGYVKGRVTGINTWRPGLQTTLIGGVAAGAAFAIVHLIG